MCRWRTLTLIILLRLIDSDLVKQLDLVNHSLVKSYNIRRLDISCPILLEKSQFVSYAHQTIEDGLLLRIEGQRKGWSVGHLAEGLMILLSVVVGLVDGFNGRDYTRSG